MPWTLSFTPIRHGTLHGSHHEVATKLRAVLRSQVGVVGLGLMGHGIAQVTAMASSPTYNVIAVEADEHAVQAASRRIEQSLSKMLSRKVKNGSISAAEANTTKADVISRISYKSDISAVADCDMIVEAITENPVIKLPFFEKLASITRPDCILASNTSSLSITVSPIA